MRATATPAPTRKGKRRLLESCAILAGLAALACGGPALAQVAGTGQAVTGPGLSIPTISPPGPGATNVNTTGDQTIINWTPTDTATTGGAIDFLPEGNTLTFNGTGNYTVLNRFVNGAGGSLSRQIALNGTVNSTNTAASGARGGNIWFYNAGGILIGATGVINVGSLVLTTNDILTTGGLFGPSGEIRFRGTAGSTSAITVNGAIDANNVLNAGSAYVALVAPRVVQAGAVRVDGSAAYVAAEQADIRINSGLFDINVLVGAEGGNVITHTGTTGGPAHQQGDIDQSRIYMVAIPKNDAVTMLVSGQIGYDDALSAQVDPDGAVRLSAGYNVTGGELNAAPANATAANITVNDTLFRSNTVARASGALVGQPLQLVPPPFLPFAPPPQQGRILVQGNGTFIGDASATFNVNAGRAVGATGNFTVQSGGTGGTPGNASVNVDGGQFGVGGTLVISALGAPASTTGNSQGGTAALSVTGGGLATIAGTASINANGVAGIGASGEGGDGRGGTARVEVSGTGSVLSAANILTNAVGTGAGLITTPAGGTIAADVGGDGFGGNASIRVENGASLSVTGVLAAIASGQGQIGLIQSGDGQGGTARIAVTGAASNLQAQATFVAASGSGGGNVSSPTLGTFDSLAAGNGQGGQASIGIDADATSTINFGTATIGAGGVGGAADGENSAGGNGQGGTASLTGAGGATTQFTSVTLDAAGDGGRASSLSGLTSSSGDGIGGTINVTAAGGTTLAIGASLALTATGVSAASDNIGSGEGGTVVVSAASNGNINVTGQLIVDAFGGSFGPAVFGLNAGSGTGGDVDLTAAGSGAIRADSYLVNASAGVVNATGTGGVAEGGTIDVSASSNGQILTTNNGTHFFDTSAITGVSAGGSSATGGTIQFIANGGTIDMGAGATLGAGGVSGGAINPGPNNPVGRGGTILIQLVADSANSSAINLGAFNASSDGLTAVNVEGSADIPRDTAGSGQGGAIRFDVQGGTLTASGINASANGFGGGTAGGAGGAVGIGGIASFTQTGGTATVGDMTISADGFGGVAQGQSGPGSGGTATIALLGGTTTAGAIAATANGLGGDGSEGNDDDPANIVSGGLGGAGQGGDAMITIGGSAVVSASTILANAAGTGGAGGEFFNASSFGGAPGTPGNGGGGTGGNAAVNINGGTTTATGVTADASGIGGAGGGSFFSSSSGGVTGVGVGGRGGTGQGGTATIGLQTAVGTTIPVNSIARGIGGDGGNHNVGGAGGDGFGGLAQAIVTNFNAGQLGVIVDSSAAGGAGADGRDGDGGNGGSATGGVARFGLEGANANATIRATNFRTGGVGGAGGDATLGFGGDPAAAPAGGSGGDGIGGIVEVLANGGNAVLVPAGIVDVGVPFPASLGSGGTGGDGGNGANTGLIGGNGGNGGAGLGGGVHLVANGGTISTAGGAIDIVVLGAAGAGGTAGSGSTGNGITGTTGQTSGGLVQLESYAAAGNAGRIDLGVTRIAANGDAAGRIELLTGSQIAMTSLEAQALGAAEPTNNDTNEAPAGIFLSAIGGMISTTGNMSLTTDSSVGAYAQSNGTVSVGGDLTITAADQIDIRHDFREGAAPTIGTTGSFTATAGGISGAPGSLLSSGGTLSLTSTLGSVGVDRLDAANIVIDAAGAAVVEHAEAANDFTATAASFRTGINSIITGGDISVTSPGTVDLGNSTAGGFVSVQGQSIAFNAIDAGTTVSLRAQGFGALDGIDGNSIVAGGGVTLNGRSVTVDNLQTDGALSVSANNGAAALGSVNADGNIFVFANGNVTGSFASGGNINLRSAANITAAANATGGYIDPVSGLAAEGSVFANADGNLTMASGSAATMFGARAGGSVALTGVTAGEDVFVLAGTTANLTGITAGDDVQAQAAGGITVQSSHTTGAGADGRSIVYQACCSNPSPFLQIQTSAADLSNVTLLAPTSTVTATNVTAFDNFTATAGGVVTTTGLTRSGLATTITGSSLNLVAITAGTDIALTANTGGISSTGALAAGHDVSVTAAGAINVSEFDAGDDVRVTTNGALTIGGAYSYGTGADNEGDGSNIVLAGGATNVTHAEAANDFVANTASFATGLNSIITGGDILITSPGAVDLGNSTAGGLVQVSSQSILFNNIDAGSSVILTASGTATGAEGISGGSIDAGGDVSLDATRMAITGTVSGGALVANSSAGPIQINLANFTDGIAISAAGNINGTYNAGGDIRLNSGANINAAANAIGSISSSSGPPIAAGVFADAAGNVALTNSSASGMFGVNAGGAATLTGVSAGEDVFVRAGTSAALANVTAGDDLTVQAAGNVTGSGLVTTGAGPDGQTLGYNDNPSSIVGFLRFTSPPNGSNIDLTSTVGNIAANSANAFDNLTALAAGTVASTGALQSGLATSLTGSSLTLTSITAGTDIALTANIGGVSSTGALAAGNDVGITAVGAVNMSELDAGDDIRIATNGALTIGGAYSYGTGIDNEGDGSNIVLTGGATNVTHAEADNDFVANVGSFTTGLNSIITGGDILVTSPGAVDLGNSAAGGFVSVTGQSIAFNNIVAGTTVGLNATGTAAGAEGIRGVNITAGGDVNLVGNSIATTGTIQGAASLFAFAGGGNAAITLADIDGDIAVIAGANLTGNYAAGGNINLSAGGNIAAQANAAGGYVGPNGISEGYVFADAGGNATLTNSSAATMLGVRAGQTASVSNAAAGEDVFVTAGTTATLATVTAGDDLTAIAPGGITANGLATTGAGPDNRTLFYGPSPSGASTLQITSAAADDSNIMLTASAGNIGGGAMDAFDNLTLVAAGAITATGTLRSGQATSINGRNIVFNMIDAGSTVDVSATGTAAGAEGIRGVGITAGGDINLDGNSIALTGIVNGDASLFATATGGVASINQANLDGNITASAVGNLSGAYAAGGAVRLNSNANIDASATASGTTAEGNLFVDAAGNVVLANSVAARMFGVNAGGSATITEGAAGEDMLVRTGTTASLTNITAGDDVDIRAGGNVTANNVRATGTGADTHFLNYLPASGFTIMQGEGTSAINGSDIVAASGGSINATALSASDDIALLAGSGNVQLSDATTLGLGSTGGASNIRVEAIGAALAGLDSADDVVVIASGTTNIGGAIGADRNISIVADAVNLATLTTPAGDAINTLSANGSVAITSANDIGGGRIRALGDIALTAGAAVDVAGIFGNNVAVNGATGIAAEQLFAVGTTTLNSDNGAIALDALVSSGNVDARADSIVINGGSMIFSNIVTDVGDAVVRAGDLFVIDGNIAGRAEFSSTGERLGIDTLVARSASLDASNGFMTLNNVTVNGGLAASARTSLAISGVVTGQSIALGSASIDIASTGRVGTAGATGEVSIANNNSDNQTYIGGTGTPNGYHIDAAELTRVFGSDIEIVAPQVQAIVGASVGSAAPPDVIVDSFTMTGGAANSNLGANGVLTIRTPGKMRVTGNVQLTGLSDTNRLNLFADQALEVILGQGSVRLVNGTAPAGQLNMVSADIIVATAAAIADVGAATTTDAIETRLAENDGILLDEGALFARGIRAEVVGGFYVQNSGTGTPFANRRGLTFGAGGLDVLTEGPSRIVLNGVQLGPNGQIAGLDTIPLLTIGGGVPAPGSFDPRSTFNGCLITGVNACTVLSLESSFPVQDVIEEETNSDGDGDANILPTPLITMRDLDPLTGEPLLDDPVTGAGNDDLWTPTLDTCDPASASGGSCPAAE